MQNGGLCFYLRIKLNRRFAPFLVIHSMTPEIHELNEDIQEIPKWKRWLYCHLCNRRLWKRVRSYNITACILMEDNRKELAEEYATRGAEIWQKIYFGQRGG